MRSNALLLPMVQSAGPIAAFAQSSGHAVTGPGGTSNQPRAGSRHNAGS